MWQLGFMFSLIPDSWIELATYAILSAGIVLYILSKLVAWIPVIKSYRFPIEVIGIVLYGLGAFYAGGYGVERMWRDRVADMEKKVQELEGRQAEVVTKIETKVVTKIKKVVEIKVPIRLNSIEVIS
jgi:predicted membrane metal-binding protein